MNIPRDTPLKKAIYACDELVGFIGACVKVRPSKKIADLPVESVVKKLKDKAFARSVDRSYVYGGADAIGPAAGRARRVPDRGAQAHRGRDRALDGRVRLRSLPMLTLNSTFAAAPPPPPLPAGRWAPPPGASHTVLLPAGRASRSACLSRVGRSRAMGTLEDFGWDDGWRVAWEGIAGGPRPVPARVIVRPPRRLRGVDGGRRAHGGAVGPPAPSGADDEAERPAVGDWVGVRLPPGDGRRAASRPSCPAARTLARKVPGPRDRRAGRGRQRGRRRRRGRPRRRLQPAAPRARARPRLATAARSRRSCSTRRTCSRRTSSRRVRATRGRRAGRARPGRERRRRARASTALGREPGAAAAPAALIGSSGVGKSTLVNRLLGAERQRTRAVRDPRLARPAHHHPSRAAAPARRRAARRHPGTARAAALGRARRAGRGLRRRGRPGRVLPLRGLPRTPASPGCAVAAAAADGHARPPRAWRATASSSGELRHLALRQDERGQREEKQRWRTIHKAARKHRPRE